MPSRISRISTKHSAKGAFFMSERRRTMPNAPRAKPNLRPDHNGPQRAQFESNKKKI